MKRSIIYIMTAAVSIAAMISCVKEASIVDGNGEKGAIRVKLIVPDIEVKSETSIPEIFAYVPSKIQAGEVSPIGCTIETSDGYLLYNLPEGTSEVIFSNISPENEYVELKDDGNGNVMFCLKEGTDGNSTKILFNKNTQILYGRLQGITGGTSEPYNVEMKRLNSRITNVFQVIDSEGSILSNESISYVTVLYFGIGESVTMHADGTIEHKAFEDWCGDAVKPSSNGEMLTSNFIPSATEVTAKVYVYMTNGTTKKYTKELGQVLESNRHYTITYKMKYLNGTGEFTLEEPQVNYNTWTPSFVQKELFTLSSSTVVGSKANDSVDIEVSTFLPYDWTATMTSGEEYFSFEKTDKGFKVTALTDNESDLRTGEILLSTEEGFSKTLKVRQKCSTPQKVVMKSQHTSSSQTIYVSGINISVKDPNDAEPRVFNSELNNYPITIDGLSSGAEVSIEGDFIIGLRCIGDSNHRYTDELGDPYNDKSSNEGYYFYLYSNMTYEYTFSNCIHLEDLCIKTKQTNVDVSDLKSLRRLYLGSSEFETLTFGENQPIESFTAYNCDKVAGFDFSKIASTVKKINLYDNDGMTGAIIVNCPELKYINVNQCSNMGVINLSGCSAIEYLRIYNNSAKTLNITNCSGLKTLSLENITLTKLLNEGVENIENIYTSNVTISGFDFSGRTALKSVGGMSCSDFSVNGCTSLETVGKITNAGALDFSECSNLKDASIDFNSNATQSIAFQNSGIESFYSRYANMDIDFSQLTELKSLEFINCHEKVTKLDLSSNLKLEILHVSSNVSNNQTLQSLSFPKSLKKVYIHDIPYFRGTLDLSGLTELEEVDICYVGNSYYNYSVDYNTYFDLLDLSGCSNLKTINKNEDNNSSNYAYCGRLKAIDLTGCSSLEECYMKYGMISKFDFSDSPNLIKIDVGSNAMDATAIDNMISTMPDRSESSIQGTYVVSGNSGASTHNEQAANDKGWWLKQ